MVWSKKSYRISQKADLDPEEIGPEGVKMMKLIRSRHREEDISGIEAEAQKLISHLNSVFSLPPLKVSIKDKPRGQWKSKRWGTVENYGYYYGKTISIYARTPKRQQLTAFKTLISTVLHEWMHHYDRHQLKIESYHTTGFYRRLNQLQEALEI